MNNAESTKHSVKVWDLFIRLFHWLLVGGIAVAAITGFLLGARAIDIHIWAGSFAAALILLRVIWGFVGGRYARFTSFLKGPRQTLHHLEELKDGAAPRHLGHNPLGGWMIVALIALITGLAATGAVVLGGVFHHGPLRALVDVAAGVGVTEIHETLANGLLILVILHVAGVVFESRRGRENLARAMVTGRKEARPGDEGQPAAKAHPLVFAALGAMVLAGGWAGGQAMAAKPVPNAPAAVSGTVYEANCTDCHMAFHPSLLPAASWQDIMATLDEHFGEDAWVAPETAAEITAFLTANAAEVTDSKPARVFSRIDPARPLEITATAFWKRTHAHLPEAVFASAPVYSRSNCAACHRDAGAGWFYPGQIDVPHRNTTTNETKGESQ